MAAAKVEKEQSSKKQ